MQQDIDAEHYEATHQNQPDAAKYSGIVEDKLTEDDYNHTAQFIFDKHEKMYTSAINYTYLSYPISGLF